MPPNVPAYVWHGPSKLDANPSANVSVAPAKAPARDRLAREHELLGIRIVHRARHGGDAAADHGVARLPGRLELHVSRTSPSRRRASHVLPAAEPSSEAHLHVRDWQAAADDAARVAHALRFPAS